MSNMDGPADISAKGYEAHLGSDLPVEDPEHDAYGYAQFASHIARAIRATPSPQGLVMAVHGPWGSGKSSLLNFVKHDLRASPKDSRPVLVDFNPWWFNGRDQLAGQLLAQFKASVPDSFEKFRLLGDLLAKYSQAVSKVIVFATGIPWLDRPVNAILQRLKQQPKDVPALKKEISRALRAANQRFVFFIDDIDRLTPDEILELFKVIKALADFPNVIYVLCFDREVVADSLTTALGVDGEAYLEKIVQAPFALPAVDRRLLRGKLYAELNSLLAQLGVTQFDGQRWSSMFEGGLDCYIKKPRDVVRVVNAISVTLPPVVGELNLADYIALESLRVLEPSAYATIRDNQDMFAGRSRDSASGKDEEKAFHAAWPEAIAAGRRRAAKNIAGQLFPRARASLEGRSWGSNSSKQWRNELRACSEDLFPAYFQFGVPADHFTQSELDRFLALPDGAAMASALTEASCVPQIDGHSKAYAMVERLRSADEQIEPQAAARLIDCVLLIGDTLLRPQDEHGGLMSRPNRWRMVGLLTAALDRVLPADRAAVLRGAASGGTALSALVTLVDFLDQADKEPSKAPDSLVGFDDAFRSEMRAAIAAKLNDAGLETILNTPDLAYVLFRWGQWGDRATSRAKFASLVADDAELPGLLERCLRIGVAEDGRRSNETYNLNPLSLEAIMDIGEEEPRVRAMMSRPDLTQRQRAAGERYLTGMERIRRGQDPDGFFIEDAIGSTA